jgi:hypothetical protein
MTGKIKKTVENTDKRLQNLRGRKPFVKGFDPRRNLKGVPRDAILMRRHMRKIAAELIGSGDTEMTRLDALLRQLFTSRNPAHSKLALQVLDPKILTEHYDVSAKVDRIEGYDYGANVAALAPGSVGDRDAPGADQNDSDGEAMG